MTSVLANNGTLTREQLATELGVKAATIALYEKEGMPVIKLGKVSLYHYPIILKWMLTRCLSSRG